MIGLSNMARLLGRVDDDWAILPASAEDCLYLSTRLADPDKIEAEFHGFTPLEALVTGYQGGPSYCVYYRGSPRGIFGWMPSEKSIWSLWMPLWRYQQRTILRWTPLCIHAMVRDAGSPLRNYVWAGNERVIGWLKATGCFVFDDRVHIEDRQHRQHLYFYTRDLSHV